MTQAELDAIRARYVTNVAQMSDWGHPCDCHVALVLNDVNALLAEVDRLRANSRRVLTSADVLSIMAWVCLICGGTEPHIHEYEGTGEWSRTDLLPPLSPEADNQDSED